MDNLQAWEQWKTGVTVEEEITPLERVHALANEIKELIEKIRKQQEIEETTEKTETTVIISQEEMEETFLEFKERIEQSVEHIKDYLEKSQEENLPEEVDNLGEAITVGAKTNARNGFECYLQAYFFLAQSLQEGNIEYCNEAVLWAKKGDEHLDYAQDIIQAATEAFPLEG